MAVSLAIAAGLLAPAPTFAYEGAVITSPANGSSVQGPVTEFVIHMGTHPAGTYDVSVTGCPKCYPSSTYQQTFSFDYDPALGTSKVVPLPAPITVATKHGVMVTRTLEPTTWNVASSAFAVARPVEPPEVYLDVNESTIFPYRRDGYLDATTITWTSDGEPNSTWLEIINSAGSAIVRRQIPAGEWRWTGRKDDGALAPVGIYTVRLTAANSLGQTSIDERSVRVAHRRVRSLVEMAKKGNQISGRREGPGCQAATGSGVLHMDCVGGTYVDAYYAFRTPRDARAIRVTVTGTADRGTIGRISFTYTRPTVRQVRARIRVTGSRAYIANNVTLTYTAKVLR